MKLSNLTQIWICSPNRTKIDGEFQTIWEYKGTEYLNLQQDLNNTNLNSVGQVDYSIVSARTNKPTIIQKKDGIYLTDISSLTNPTPDYTVKGILPTGRTKLITLNQYNGDE